MSEIRKQISATFTRIFEKQPKYMDPGQLLLIAFTLERVDPALSLKYLLLAGQRMEDR